MVRVVVAALLSISLVACQGEQQAPDGAVSSRYCTKTSNNLAYEYQVVRFASGDVEAICSVSSYTDQRSATVYYRRGDAGTATGRCWVYYDLVTPNDGGYFDFLADGGERVTYYDSGSTYDPLPFAAGDCTG